MTKVEFFVERQPEGKGYGMVAIVNGGVRPVGPQDFTSEERAINAFVRSLGDAIKPPV